MKVSSIFDKNELTSGETFEKAKIILDKKKGFVYKLLRSPHFNDEPKYFHYVAYIKKSSECPSFSSVGCSLDDKKAQMKALTEAVERYCMYAYDKRKFLKSSYEKFKYNALDPKSIVSFSSNQLRKKIFEVFRVTRDSVFKWVQGLSLISKKPIWVPAQLVSLTYKFGRGEKIIRFPITNGAASGSSFAGSVTRGIWECIERDAFIITYLNKLPREKITTEDSDIKNILDYFSRYKLEVHPFDITTDIKIPTILSIIIDRTGKGPVVCMGTKTSLNTKEALIGSIDEAALIRMHMRKVFLTERVMPKKLNLNDHKDRVLYWSNPKMIKHLSFLLNSKNTKDLNEIENNNGNTLSNLKETVKILKKKNIETVIVDITKPCIRRYGFKVTMVIMPELQPFYLREGFPYFGGRRLYTVPKILGYANDETKEEQLNKIPHPF